MTEMKTRGDSWHRHHFPCDCGDWHYLDVTVDDDDSRWRWLNLADTYMATRWRDRIKGAWTILRGKEHCHRGVILDEYNVRDLKAVIDSLVKPG